MAAAGVRTLEDIAGRTPMGTALALPGRTKMAQGPGRQPRILPSVKRTAFGLDDVPQIGRCEDLLAAALADDPDQSPPPGYRPRKPSPGGEP